MVIELVPQTGTTPSLAMGPLTKDANATVAVAEIFVFFFLLQSQAVMLLSFTVKGQSPDPAAKGSKAVC